MTSGYKKAGARLAQHAQMQQNLCVTQKNAKLVVKIMSAQPKI